MRSEIMSLSRGIDVNSFPYQLFQKAKQFGTWNPSDIDFSQDKEDWKRLSPEQKQSLKLRVSRFIIGEESVTMDILPMIMTVAKKGWLEEEMFLTSFIFEEAKHVEFFNIFLKEIGEMGDLSFSNEDHKKIWFEMLPSTMNRLLTDPSPQNIAEAAAMYNLFLEGVQAKTSYYLMYEGVRKMNIMPGLMEGIDKLKTDESRHISFGIYILQRLIREEPELYDFVENKLRNEWWPYAEGAWSSNALDDSATDGFGMKISDILEYARNEMNVRLSILKKATETELLNMTK
ncbi:R2-like ligand-binding oxidase [Niallia oryzisoli]|uniref:R2-like ligand-binding oxidase n=1 Tax=Niallia oryzisoli TaxID=1737571 RepID=A0ABZ2C8Q6_9BACI